MLLKNGSKTIRYRDRRIEDVPTWLEVQRQRFKCKTCGATIYECLPDLDDKHRITKRLREAVALSAVKRTHQDAATFHAVEETLVSRIFNEYATEKLSGFEVDFPEVLGVDENYILGANRFIHADIETGKILDILPSRDLKTLRNYFQKHTHSSTKTKVFVQDMWSGYRTIHNEFFPDSLLVVDKFHVVRQANVAFENARKAYQAQLGKSGRGSMKRRHRMFLSRWDNMTNERQDKIAEILGPVRA
nr:transposase [Acetobacter pasteurianus]